MHLPLLWRFRLLRAIRAKGVSENRRLLGAWQRAEGGGARYNPLNTTWPLPGATDYNTAHVKNYKTGSDGLLATTLTLNQHYYAGIVRDLQLGLYSAENIVRNNRSEFTVWGTNPDTILAVLAAR